MYLFSVSDGSRVWFSNDIPESTALHGISPRPVKKMSFKTGPKQKANTQPTPPDSPRYKWKVSLFVFRRMLCTTNWIHRALYFNETVRIKVRIMSNYTIEYSTVSISRIAWIKNNNNAWQFDIFANRYTLFTVGIEFSVFRP